jgi:minor curlin subunit
MFEASVIGDNNSSTIGQYGNENIINQDLVGNDMSFILTQRGNNNEISQTENDQQSRQYEIIQNGDGMKLIIINGGILP